MPYLRHTGRTSRSTSRTSSEYGGCSHMNRSRPRRSAVHCASTICDGGKVEEPIARTFPARTRSLRAPRVSSMSVSCSGRWIWYRSIQSVPSRLRLASHSFAIHRRELPNWFGSSPIVPWTVVAAILECLADDLLRLPARVHVGGVDEVDPRVERTVDDPDRLVVVLVAPVAEHHGAEAERADVRAGGSESAVLHRAEATPRRTAGSSKSEARLGIA